VGQRNREEREILVVIDMVNYTAEQTIKKTVTVNAASTGSITLAIPADVEVAIKGYGYSWFSTTTTQLKTGQITLPSRADQEGSTSIPRMFGVPLPCRSGGNIEFLISNTGSANHTYEVVFYLFTTKILTGAAYESEGGELIVSTGSGSGSGSSVAVYDSTFATAASVTAFGLAVDPTPPTTLNDGSTPTTSAAALALGASTALRRGVLVQASTANTANLLVGNATSQSISLSPGQSEFIEVNNLNKVYIRRPGAVNVTANYHAF